MPHSQKLTDLKEFKLALWGPLGAAVIVAIIITVADYLSTESLQFCLTSECFNDAINRHKFSLGVAALVFPLVALVAAYHRSVQAAAQISRADAQLIIANKQIEMTSSKNNFENYIKHKDEFRSKIEKFVVKNYFIDINFDKLYSAIFYQNSSNLFEPYFVITNSDKFILNKIFKKLVEMNCLQKKVSYLNYLRIINLYLDIENDCSGFIKVQGYDLETLILRHDWLSEFVNKFNYIYDEIYQFSSNEKREFETENSIYFNFKKFEELAVDENVKSGLTGVYGSKDRHFGDNFLIKLQEVYKANNLQLEHLNNFMNSDLESLEPSSSWR